MKMLFRNLQGDSFRLSTVMEVNASKHEVQIKIMNYENLVDYIYMSPLKFAKMRPKAGDKLLHCDDGSFHITDERELSNLVLVAPEVVARQAYQVWIEVKKEFAATTLANKIVPPKLVEAQENKTVNDKEFNVIRIVVDSDQFDDIRGRADQYRRYGECFIEEIVL